ncbi:MAG: polyprenyl synthetase family protein [Simkaniaceae bacterium]|nr:polyprenyl synthetase family protein [Simkaniaceae bacterium]
MILHSYFRKFEKGLKKSIPELCESGNLRDACEYALFSGGKRLRPIIVLGVADCLNSVSDVMQAAIAVEFFHTASLIADDLPCMDDDDERRGSPSLHKAYGETTALLASYGLISEAFQKIHGATVDYCGPNSELVARHALDVAARGSGFQGATGGQFMDMFPPGKDLETVQVVIEKKTVRLFEVAFLLGWLYGGGDLNLMGEVEKLSYDFGMAFQIADDLSDYEKDARDGELMNLALLHGKEFAVELMNEHLSSFSKRLKELRLDGKLFDAIIGKVHAHAGAAAALAGS